MADQQAAVVSYVKRMILGCNVIGVVESERKEWL